MTEAPVAFAHGRPDPGMIALLRDELQPYDGRLRMAVHMALLCGATAVVAMTLRVPEALVACYLIFFAYKDNAGEGVLIGMALIVAATLAIGAGIGLLMLVADAPAPRFALILALTFVGMFLWRASRMGPAAYALAFILAFILILADSTPIPEFLVRGLTWLWVVVFIPMALLVISNILFGRSPRALGRRVIAERLSAAADLLEGRTIDPAPMLEAGNAEALHYLKMARFMGEVRGHGNAERLASEIDASHRILAAAAAGAGSPAMAPLLRRLAAGERVETPAAAGPLEDATASLVRARDPACAPHAPAREKPGFFKPDAFTNPAYRRFAIKTMLAVATTYILIMATDLFDIHTAIVTCFFVAVGTGGEVFHKSSLRLTGCLIGTAMGALAVRFIVPHLSDAGHLFALVTAGSFMAAWVALGSWRVQYLGWQMALAFFICVLPGSPFAFGPSVDLADAGYRILGIVLGITVMGLIFALIWPESAESALDRETTSALQAAVAALRGADRLEVAHGHLGAARLAGEVMAFERLGVRHAALRRRSLLDRLDAARTLVRLAPLLATRPDAGRIADAVAAAVEGQSPAHRNPSGEPIAGLLRRLQPPVLREFIS